ncbi:hypothetical protein F2P79_008978 [Pimephales promelas]|nr:hypothetical protein F2P79_008978 [Pimephales promelas]
MSLRTQRQMSESFAGASEQLTERLRDSRTKSRSANLQLILAGSKQQQAALPLRVFDGQLTRPSVEPASYATAQPIRAAFPVRRRNS